MSHLRLARAAALVAVAALPTASATIYAGPADPPPYTQVAELPYIIDGQVLRTFIYDPMGHRLYAGSDRGLFWSDLDDPHPRMSGPLFKRDIVKIELALDVGRLYYIDTDEIGYINLDQPETPIHLDARDMASDMVYEPTRRELYVASFRRPSLRVFDARSGERAPSVTLPGWWGMNLEAVPGRVFMTLAGQDGIYAVDAATHQLARWKVKGRISIPDYIEADPSGRYLFLTYYRQVVAIDIPAARVVGRVVMPSRPTIAFDPGTNLLVATWENAAPPIANDVRMGAYAVTPEGLSLVSSLKNPPRGSVGVEPTDRGFIQTGTRVVLVWQAPQASATIVAHEHARQDHRH